MSEADIRALEKQLEAMKKAKQERWEPLRKKYGNEKNPAKVLYKCLVNEEEGKDEDQWIENIKLCFDKMDSPDQKLEPQYRLPVIGDHPRTILGVMITWQKDHPKVEKFLRGKLDFHKVIKGELYMNTWAWGERVSYEGSNMWSEAKPVFLAVLYGKTRWLKELLELGAKTGYGYFLRKSLWDYCQRRMYDAWPGTTGYSSYWRRLTPTQLNDYLDPDTTHFREDVKLKARLKEVDGLEGDKLKERVRKIRKEIEQILIIGGADRAKIKDSGNPQGLKLKY